jgi:hypothetical protein
VLRIQNAPRGLYGTATIELNWSLHIEIQSAELLAPRAAKGESSECG